MIKNYIFVLSFCILCEELQGFNSNQFGDDDDV
jgi:hypothetical protein